MLSDRSRPVLEATLPVAEHLGEIARRFHAHMFQEHPELLDGISNRGNQAEGTQQVALAGSVAAFAGALLTTPERSPEHLMSRIAHEHVSLDLRPDHYQVVHDSLRGAPPVQRRAGARRRPSPTARSRTCCTTASRRATC